LQGSFRVYKSGLTCMASLRYVCENSGLHVRSIFMCILLFLTYVSVSMKSRLSCTTHLSYQQVGLICGALLILYGVATVSRIDKIIGLFCRMLSLLQGSFAKETYNSIDPTNQSHPIGLTCFTIQFSCLFNRQVSFVGLIGSSLRYICLLSKQVSIFPHYDVLQGGADP